ncbi:MAG: Ig-like domain-containing protein, partial [Desulfococcaceae bacterium]|nr:Ig-like domain-containing protein [Desulfococcaceae bacterium]
MTATSESAKKSFRRSCGISVLFCLLILGGLSDLTCSSAYAAVYVDKDAVSGANNGSSWADAFTNLKMALEETGAGEIWVAEGTYYPTTAPNHTAETDRTLFFPLNDGIFLYGGFNGTESLLSERDPVANVTILSGDIGAAGDNTDNNLHVVYAGGAPASVALLDGFTVTGGNASGTVFPDNSGAGIYNEVSLSVKNCIVIGNRAVSGGGMYNYFGNPLLDNCTFSNNTAVNFDGGGICHYGGNLTLSRSLISSNTAEQNGGGIYIYSAADSLIHLSNCTISGNGAAGDTMQVFGGGAIYYGGTVSGTGAMSLLNCTVYNNSSSDGHCGGILNNSVFTVNMHNTILAGNTDTMGFADYYGTLNSLGYNIIQGGGGTFTGDTGTNITGTDPVLSPLADNGGSTQTHALPAGSIAIDAGDPAFASPPDFDQRGDGFPRLNNCRVDIGAYESDLIPEIQVSDEGGTDIVSGSGIADFGSTPLGTSVPKIFTVNNTGTNDLVLSNPTVPTGFIISSFVPPIFVSPSGSASFTVLLDAATAGTFSGALQFDTTDYCDENPFTFTVQGTVALPEIDIFQGTIPIAGGGTYDFGAVAVNANSGPVVFTISNTGGADLILTGTPLMVNLSGADASEFAVDESATSLTLAPAGTTTFAVTFSPMTAEGKTAQISVGNNDSDENPYIISLSGSGQNTAPAASDDGPYTVTEDSVSPLTLEPPGVLGNDSDANGDSIAAVLLTDPAHALSFDLFSDGSFTYTPALNFSGTDFFTYKVNDGFLDSAEATVTISVTAVNDPPVITSAAPTSGTEDLPYSYQVTVDDPDDAGNGTDISFSLSGEPAGMTVSPTGLITWTPGEGVITSGSVTVTAADGGEDGAQPATQSFSVTVTPVNDPPEFTSSAVLSVAENTLYNYDISATDIDSTELFITAPVKPEWLTLTDNGDGTALLSGTPTAADAGEHTVILLVKDADDAQDTQEFIITVSPENTPPEILNLDGDTLIYSEGPMPLDEGQDALVSDADGPGLDYGYLHVEITEGGSAEDIL